MATLGGKLITREVEWNANMTDQRHLGKALMIKPAQFGPVVEKLFSAQNYYSDNPLLSKFVDSEQYINGTSWEWEMKAANTRPLVVMENLHPEKTEFGKLTREFDIILDENWFLEGDYISPGNPKYQVRLMSGAQIYGEYFKYKARVSSDSMSAAIPARYLRKGATWSKLYSKYAEATELDGSTQFSTPIAFTSKLSKYRKQYRITDYASTEVLAIGIPDSNGTIHRSWIRYAEVEYFQQWHKELERGVWYSRSTDTIMDNNGRPVRSGPGIQELLEDSHVERYTHLSARFLEDYLMTIFYGRTKPGKMGRQVEAYTGEYGMLQFHRAIEDRMMKSGFIRNVEVYTNKINSELHGNAQEFGYQFVKYNMANGASLKLIHNPVYDDLTIHNDIDPITGYPYESQRITFLDFGGTGNKSNVKIIKKKDGFAFGYVRGMYGPYGPADSTEMAHSGDYYSMHIEQNMGVQITDPTRCGELILDRA